MFNIKKPIFIDVFDSHLDTFNISIKKNDVNFSIRIKEVIKDGVLSSYVWFIHVECPKTKIYKVCTFSTKQYECPRHAQEDALICLNNFNNEFFNYIKKGK